MSLYEEAVKRALENNVEYLDLVIEDLDACERGEYSDKAGEFAETILDAAIYRMMEMFECEARRTAEAAVDFAINQLHDGELPTYEE